MIEISGYRIRWDGSYNYVLERRATDKDGKPKTDKNGDPSYTNQKYYGRELFTALGSLQRRLIEDDFNDIETLDELVEVSKKYRDIINTTLEESRDVIKSLADLPN